MNIFKKLYNYLFVKEKKSEITQVNIKSIGGGGGGGSTTPNKEPSCIAKGIAKLWLEEDGWIVSRKKVAVHYYGSGGNGLFEHYAVQLKYPKLGIEINLSEYLSFPSISMGRILINGDVVVQESYWQNHDSIFIQKAILSKAYPALKKRLDKQKKEDESRQARIDAVKKIGCPDE